MIVVAIVAVLGAILVVRIQDVRFQQRIALCLSNVRSFGTAAYTFADDHKDDWPMTADRKAFASGARTITYAPGRIGYRREVQIDPNRLQAGEGDPVASTTRGLWQLLHVKAGLTPLNFVCPETKDKPNADPDPKAFWDFRGYSEVSYGYQVPFGRFARPSSDIDSRVPLIADRGPYGAALESGTPAPPVPPDVTAGTSLPRNFWKPFNSPNHRGLGQCVLYAASHGEFHPDPAVGVGRDNIYTRWSSPTGTPGYARHRGLRPTGTETPASDTDTLIYP